MKIKKDEEEKEDQKNELNENESSDSEENWGRPDFELDKENDAEK